MPAVDPNNLGSRVSARDLNWGDLVRRAWGPEFSMPDKGAYEFSNGRKWESTDRGLTGLYGVDAAPPFEFDYAGRPTHYDVDTTLMVSDQNSTELLYIDADPNPHVCAGPYLYGPSAVPGINTPGCAIPHTLSGVQPLPVNRSAVPHVAIAGYAIPSTAILPPLITTISAVPHVAIPGYAIPSTNSAQPLLENPSSVPRVAISGYAVPNSL